jgi:transcriptional regulator with XRE-family HTH domain
MLARNIKYLRKKNKISQQDLASALDLPRTTLGDYERGKNEPNINMLIRMAEKFNISLDELITKDLSMEDYEIIKSKDLRVLAISVDKNKEGNIELVDTKAEAGYLESYSDPEYIKDLPKIGFPNIPTGTYRGFEISGDSMLPVEPGSIIIADYMEKFEDIKDDKTYVIVSKNEGLVYKRIKKLKDKNQLLLISDNEYYKPYTIDFNEVAEIWQYYAHLSFSDSKLLFNSIVEDKLNEIQQQLSEIHTDIKKK